MWQLISCALACAAPTAHSGYELEIDDCQLKAKVMVRFQPELKAACLTELGDVWTTDIGWVHKVTL